MADDNNEAKNLLFLKLEESCTIWVGAQASVNWPKQTGPFESIMKYESCIYVWVYMVWIINKPHAFTRKANEIQKHRDFCVQKCEEHEYILTSCTIRYILNLECSLGDVS